MDPDLRTALLALASIFCLAFAAMTVTVIADTGLDVLSITALVIVAMVLFGLYGAIRNPPG